MEIKKRKSPIFFQDKMVLFLLLALFIAESVVVFFLYAYVKSTVWLLLWLHLPIVVVLDPYRYVVWHRFEEEGIERHTLFRKKIILPYTNFPYLLLGKYLHGAFWRYYLIFTDRKMSEYELSHINHVAPTDRIIKVQYSRKTYCVLKDVLPPKLLASLPANIARMGGGSPC